MLNQQPCLDLRMDKTKIEFQLESRFPCNQAQRSSLYYYNCIQKVSSTTSRCVLNALTPTSMSSNAELQQASMHPLVLGCKITRSDARPSPSFSLIQKLTMTEWVPFSVKSNQPTPPSTIPLLEVCHNQF